MDERRYRLSTRDMRSIPYASLRIDLNRAGINQNKNRQTFPKVTPKPKRP